MVIMGNGEEEFAEGRRMAGKTIFGTGGSTSRSKPQDAWKGTDGAIAEDIGTMPSIAAQFAD